MRPGTNNDPRGVSHRWTTAAELPSVQRVVRAFLATAGDADTDGEAAGATLSHADDDLVGAGVVAVREIPRQDVGGAVGCANSRVGSVVAEEEDGQRVDINYGSARRPKVGGTTSRRVMLRGCVAQTLRLLGSPL